MDPEGSKNSTTSMEHESVDDKKMISGNAIWTYRKPIFTAIVIPKKDAGTTTDEKAVPLLAATDKELAVNDKLTEDDASTREERDQWLFSSLYKYSLVFGLVIGCFIQSSSLGANYILMILFRRDSREMAQHQSALVTFSLGWSFLTSLMGILMLLILRSLVASAARGLNQNNVLAGRPTVFSNTQQSLVAFLEFPFAFGALAGVCLSWAAIDITLGLRSHAYNSLYTLVFAYVGKVVFEAFSPKTPLEKDDEEDELNTEELIKASRKESEDVVVEINKEFKVKGLLTGLLVGFFIQFSSLGASFLIDALARGTDAAPMMLTKQRLLFFSLGWSFVFGTMGVAILLLLRFLVGIVCDRILCETHESEDELEDEEEETVDRWSMSLEFFFAVGCLVGVNVAWLITDLGLGLNALVWRSLGTLAVAAVWCCILAHSFGFETVIYNAPFTSRRGRRRGKKVTKATQTTQEGFLIV